jgi:hypothetical protein
MTLRPLTGLLITCLVTTSSVAAQSSPTARAEDLRSSEPAARELAFEKLNRHPDTFAVAGMAELLLATVKKENALIYGTLSRSNGQEGVSDRYGEGYGEYASVLSEVCLRYCNLSNPDAVRTLASGPFAGASVIGQTLAAKYPALVLPIALENARRGTFGRQIEGIDLLAETLRLEHTLTAVQRRSLDSALVSSMGSESQIVSSIAVNAVNGAFQAGAQIDDNRRAAYHRALIAATKSAYTDTRIGAVRGIAQFRDPQDRALLTELAARDSARTTKGGRIQFPVRDAASTALAALARP